MNLTEQWQEKVLEPSLAASEALSSPANREAPEGHPGFPGIAVWYVSQVMVYIGEAEVLYPLYR